MFYVYILQSKMDATYYVGYTSHLENRLNQHNNGDSKYTSKKLPWQLVYFEEFKTKKDALKREKFLKSQRNTAFYQKLVSHKDR